MVNQLIFENKVSRPKKLLIELGAKKDIETPSLDQIRNFLEYLRMKLGDSNNMEGVEEFVTTHTYFPGYDPDKLFVFGVHLGDGSDDDHFYFGFKTLNLIKHVEFSNN